MHHRRFNNKLSRHRLDFQGKFSIIHLGGGSFLYTFPGKVRPVVGRIDLSQKKLRNQGIGLVMIIFAFVGIFGFLSNTGTATAVSDPSSPEELEKLEGKLSPIELEKKSDELKNKILNEDRPDPKHKGMIKYTVRSGDTLSVIAKRFKVPVSLITKSSKISVHSVLRPGQELTIPDRPGLVYKVKKKDRIAKVADYYSVNLEDILRDNPELTNLDLVKPGQKIFLPDAKIPKPPPVWRVPAYGRFTSGFGWRRHPIYGYRHFHSGLDIAIAYKPVRAARNGIVTYAGRLGGYGYAVIIEHDRNLKTLYAHLSRIHVRRGQTVKAGSLIATSGNTGISTGPHLHFEVIRNGKTVNPRRYVKF